METKVKPRTQVPVVEKNYLSLTGVHTYILKRLGQRQLPLTVNKSPELLTAAHEEILNQMKEKLIVFCFPILYNDSLTSYWDIKKKNI